MVLHPSNASPADISGPNSAEVSPYTSTLTPVIGSATQVSLLPMKFAHEYPGLLPNVRPLGESSTSALVPGPNPEMLCVGDRKEG